MRRSLIQTILLDKSKWEYQEAIDEAKKLIKRIMRYQHVDMPVILHTTDRYYRFRLLKPDPTKYRYRYGTWSEKKGVRVLYAWPKELPVVSNPFNRRFYMGSIALVGLGLMSGALLLPETRAVIETVQAQVENQFQSVKGTLKRLSKDTTLMRTLKSLSRSEGVPVKIIISVITVESGGDYRAYRREKDNPYCRASYGLFQICGETADELVKNETDLADVYSTGHYSLLYDPIVSARLGVRILRRNFEEFHDWRLATAAYNAGVGGVKKRLKRLGTDKWDDRLLRPGQPYSLPRYTRVYVKRIFGRHGILDQLKKHPEILKEVKLS